MRDYHGWQDGSADNSACHQGWWPWLNLWDTEGRKKELTPPTYTVTHVHICTYKEIKICCLKRKEVSNYISLGSNLISALARFMNDPSVFLTVNLGTASIGLLGETNDGVYDALRFSLSAQWETQWAWHLFLALSPLFVILLLVLLWLETLHIIFVRTGRWSRNDCSCSL